MFGKRTRLYIYFNLIDLLKIVKNFFKKNKNFLDYLKKVLKTKNLSLTSYGRVALYDIVKLIIFNTNKKIFVIAPYTIPAVIHAIKYAGGEVLFVDIDKKTGLINEEKLRTTINSEIAAVIITHLYSSEESIVNFINNFKNKILIIEDAAINFGAKVNNKYIGTLGDYGFFSFALVKNLNTITGGAIYIKDDIEFQNYQINKKNKSFPISLTLNTLLTAIIIKIFFNNLSYQITHYLLNIIYRKKIKIILKKIYPVLFHELKNKTPIIYSYDFNWIMNDLGVHNLKKINDDIKGRIRKAELYKNYINDDVAIKTNCLKGDNALLEYPIILKKNQNLMVCKELMKAGFDIRRTWYINNVKNEQGYKKIDFEDTYYLEQRILCLPLHKNIYDQDIVKISKIINKINY